MAEMPPGYYDLRRPRTRDGDVEQQWYRIVTLTAGSGAEEVGMRQYLRIHCEIRDDQLRSLRRVA